MATDTELLLVKQIIADGYTNLDAISYELDIPMNVLNAIYKQVQQEKRAAELQRINESRLAADIRAKSIDKLGQLRRNYELAYNGIDPKSKNKELPVIIPDSEVVAEAIKKIESFIEKKEGGNQKVLTNVLAEIAALKKEPMSVEQAVELLDILYNGELLNVRAKEKLLVPQGDSRKTAVYTINIYRKQILSKLLDAIRAKCTLSNDISELNALNLKLYGSIEKLDYVAVTTLKGRIQAKITQLNKEKAIRDSQILNEDMITIIVAMSSGEMDDSVVDTAIDNEAERRLQKQKSFYRTSKEKQIEQKYYQVSKAIEEHAEEYPIKFPQKTIELLESKFGMGFDANLRAVIHNFIERKEFVAASYFCDRYTKLMGEDNNHTSNISTLRSDIKRAEIGQIILRGIHVDATPEEKDKFFDFLEKKMQQTRYGHNLIPIGRTKDGTKKLTLADIWEEERNPKR